MSKRMSNKKAKQMIADVVLQGRKAYWYGQENDVYAAMSFEHINDYFGDFEEEDEFGNLISADWRYWWQDCLNEQATDSKGKFVMKGSKAFNKSGEVMVGFEVLPLISAVYGGGNEVAIVSVRDI